MKLRVLHPGTYVLPGYRGKGVPIEFENMNLEQDRLQDDVFHEKLITCPHRLEVLIEQNCCGGSLHRMQCKHFNKFVPRLACYVCKADPVANDKLIPKSRFFTNPRKYNVKVLA